MTLQAVIPGKLRNGRVLLPAGALARAVEGWRDSEVVVTVRPEAHTRSIQQLRYYRGVVLPIMAEATGQDEDSIHDDMCERFLSRRRVHYVNPATGEVDERDVARRTTGLTVAEFMDFTERVRLFAAEFLGLTIPDPVR